MEKQKIKALQIIGIAVRTTNENGQSAKDIPKLWNKFMSEGVMDRIPGKVNSNLYCIYTEYEKDHTRPYTAILGCEVSNMNLLPDEMVKITIEEGNYIKRKAKGNPIQNLIFEEWTKIWNSDLPRNFTTDFELYGEKAQDPEMPEVDIYLSVK